MLWADGGDLIWDSASSSVVSIPPFVIETLLSSVHSPERTRRGKIYHHKTLLKYIYMCLFKEKTAALGRQACKCKHWYWWYVLISYSILIVQYVLEYVCCVMLFRCCVLSQQLVTFVSYQVDVFYCFYTWWPGDDRWKPAFWLIWVFLTMCNHGFYGFLLSPFKLTKLELKHTVWAATSWALQTHFTRFHGVGCEH